MLIVFQSWFIYSFSSYLVELIMLFVPLLSFIYLFLIKKSTQQNSFYCLIEGRGLCLGTGFRIFIILLLLFLSKKKNRSNLAIPFRNGYRQKLWQKWAVVWRNYFRPLCSDVLTVSRFWLPLNGKSSQFEKKNLLKRN